MYIGQKKIARAPEENGNITVFYEDDTREVMTKRMFEVSKTEEPIELTALRDRQCPHIAKDILQVLFAWDIKWLDYDEVDRLVRNSLHAHQRYAEEKLWGKNREDVRLSDIDRVKTNVQTPQHPSASRSGAES